MTKAFRTLVDDRTEVGVETGLRAAEKLQSVLDGRERGTEVLELKVQLGNISKAVRSVVPQSMWAAILEELEELEQQSDALDVDTDSFDDDDDDDPYDPTEFIDEDDGEVLTYVRCAHRHRGLLGTAAGVDGAFAVAWTMSGVADRCDAAPTACQGERDVLKSV